jgi:hypothetical protein
MHRAPRIPRAQVMALSRPDPLLSEWRSWSAVAVALGLLLLALLAR